MKIEKLSECSVKIVLSKSDLSDYNISYDSWNSDVTADFLLSVCDEIKASTGKDISNEKLYVEIFSCTSGCQIFISYPPMTSGTLSDNCCLICDFCDFNNLKSFCSDICHSLPKAVKNSALYYSNVVLRLILSVQPKHEEIIFMLADECHITRCDEISFAAASEYYKCVIDKDAVKQIAGIKP